MDREPIMESSRSNSLTENPFTILPNKTALEWLKISSSRLVRSLEDRIRFCVFNTEHTNKREFWAIIKDRLNPEILSGVHRIQNVCQLNGRKQMDM